MHFDAFDINTIQDLKTAQKTILTLLNIIEDFHQDNLQLKKQVQHLADEINRLKGEQGKPKIKANTSDKNEDKDKRSASDDHSSEKERSQKKKKWKKSKKVERIIVNEEKIC